MKNYSSYVEGEWKEVLLVTQTEEERIIISGPDSEEKTATIKAIADRALVNVDAETLELLTNKYNSVKETIEDVANKKYVLTGCNLTVFDDKIVGVLGAIVDDTAILLDIK